MTRATRDVYQFLQSKVGLDGEMWWGQDRIRIQVGCTIRTVGRAIRALKELGLLEVTRRGSTSNVYRLILIGQNVRTDRTKCPNVSIILNLEEEKKPAARELRSELPPYEVTNEYGRRVVNPERLRIEGILRRARDRISKATHPEAYVRKIISDETRRSG